MLFSYVKKCECYSCQEAREYKGFGKVGKCSECGHLYIDDAPYYTMMCQCELKPDIKCKDYEKGVLINTNLNT